MKRKLAILFVSTVFCLGSLTSCSNDDSPAANPTPKPAQDSEKPTEHKSIILDSPQTNAHIGTQKFAYRFLKEALAWADQKGEQNFMVSPLGFSNLLTILANGADPEALEEITKVLESSLDDLNSFYKLLSTALPTADNQVTFANATGLWLHKGVIVNQDFTSLLKDSFNADIIDADLGTVETKDAINQWCYDNTGGMIGEFLKSSLPADTRMFVANALYFNGGWTAPFDRDLTSEGDFTCASGKISKVKMMKGKDEIEYTTLPEGGELISIPYGNKSFSLNIYLPEEGRSVAEALELNQPWYLKSVGPGWEVEELSLPKFNISYSMDELTDVARSMGLERIFGNDAFPRIAADLTCGNLKQDSELVVDEEGAKAASVSGGRWVGGWNHEVKTPPVVKIDRPFIFSITETTNSIVLFAGVVRDL